METETAFALAGLGGFNAHGAGFLQAARDNGYVPDLITATSGQILVLDRYLAGKDLKAGLIDEERERDPLAQVETALFGYPGVFRPAYAEAARRLLQPPAFTDSLIDMVADRWLPAQQYVPARSDQELADVAERLNHHARIGGKEIGVIFNAYDPVSGEGVLYGNDTARAMMKPVSRSKLPVEPTADALYGRQGPLESPIREITGDAVKAALWLSLYGFEGLPKGRMDGAYHRSCILSELHNFTRVVVVRPLANGWLTDKPRNWFDVQDWQCEMWFSVGYKAEVDAMKRINTMIEVGDLAEWPASRFKRVHIHEIEPATPAGYFNFFIERSEVYDRAYALADAFFFKLRSNPGELEPPRGASRLASLALSTPDGETLRGLPAPAGSLAGVGDERQ